MTTYTTKPLAVSVFQKGESPVFSDTAFHVSVEDHAAGPFIKILEVNTGEKIAIDLDQLEIVYATAKRLIEEHEAE
ncbi:MAG: hypothetical protein KIT80_23480 [Chitinophagaceae bacterium]|nr:hypothetical protein [Nitrosomonas sp.]MCW5929902.1 hypothetical protein [Chitinophagaceae bacterium]